MSARSSPICIILGFMNLPAVSGSIMAAPILPTALLGHVPVLSHCLVALLKALLMLPVMENIAGVFPVATASLRMLPTPPIYESGSRRTSPTKPTTARITRLSMPNFASTSLKKMECAPAAPILSPVNESSMKGSSLNARTRPPRREAPISAPTPMANPTGPPAPTRIPKAAPRPPLNRAACAACPRFGSPHAILATVLRGRSSTSRNLMTGPRSSCTSVSNSPVRSASLDSPLMSLTVRR